MQRRERKQPFSNQISTETAVNEITISKFARKEKKEQGSEYTSYVSNFNKYISNFHKQELVFILSSLQKSGYYLKKYLICGSQGDIFYGVYMKNGSYGECTSKIMKNYCSNKLQQEIEMMKKCQHSLHAIRFIDFLILPQNYSVIVLEKCNTSLKEELDHIKSQSFSFPFNNFFKMVLDLMDGLVQLKILKVLHLHIRPENILISKEGNYIYTDFIYAQSYLKTPRSIIKEPTPNPVIGQWVAFTQKETGFDSDLYSLGQIMMREIIPTFKKKNPNYSVIEEFEKTIVEKMVQYRDDIIVSYSKKIEMICQKIPFEKDKTGPLSDIKIFYLKLQIKLFQKINIALTNPLNHLRINNLDIGSSKINSLSYAQLESLKMERDLSSRNKLAVAASYNHLGLCYFDKNDPVKAIFYQQESLNIQRELLQKGNHLEVAHSLCNLGKYYKLIGDSTNALRFQLESLKMFRQNFQGNHPFIATSLYNMGCHYNDIGDSKKALIYHLDSLEMKKQLFKGNHADIFTSLNKIVFCYRDIGDSIIAVSYQLQLLNLVFELSTENHTSMTKSQNNNNDNIGL